MNCIVCKNNAPKRLTKKGVDYFQCEYCKTLFSRPLDNSNMVGGGMEEERNSTQNQIRIGRFDKLVGNKKNKYKILDFGCGHGMLVKDLYHAGFVVNGYDAFNPEYINIQNDGYKIVTMIEVIEHLSKPFSELDLIYKKMDASGIVYIETSFVDVAEQEGIALEDFFYIEPSVGHSTIFSHKGLDILMRQKGFLPFEHIDRNTRLYRKNNISLITMGQGNPNALKTTLDSFKNVVSEVIYGDMLIFDDDRKKIKTYQLEYNLKMVEFPFNFIFEYGFSQLLNSLAAHSSHDLVIYMNTGEIIDGEERILALIDFWRNENYNCYPFDHATDPHTWVRTYNKNELSWGGLIHEDLVGDRRTCPYYLFRMADTDKDTDSSFKSKCYDDIKEIVYFQQYVNLVETPSRLGATNAGWLEFAKQDYNAFKERLLKKGVRYEAFKEGDLGKYMNDVMTNTEFHKERFESSLAIEFQNDPKFLNK